MTKEEFQIVKKIKADIPYWDLKNDDINECLERIDDLFPDIESVPAETSEDNELTVENLKCCGNCYYFDIIDNLGGVCDKDSNQMPCTKNAICDDWKFDAER